MPNPFFPAIPVPPEKFVGRRSQVVAAISQIQNRGHLAIWGGPGMGKTSYLKKVAQTWQDYALNASPAILVFLACLDDSDMLPFTPAKFWKKVLTSLHDQLETDPELRDQIRPLVQDGTFESLRQAIQCLHRRNKYLVLLVDDFDVALVTNSEYLEGERETFLAQCRALAVGIINISISMIVSSLKRLNELGPPLRAGASPWYNHYVYQSLKPFIQRELDELLTPFTPELRQEIQDITGGHPVLVQIAGHLYQLPHEDGTKLAQEFQSATQHIFEKMWETCNEKQRILLMLIVLLEVDGELAERNFDLRGIGRTLMQNERILDQLEEQGIITSRGTEEKFYTFTSKVMKQFVVQEIWNTNESEIRNKEKVLLDLLSHEQIEQVKKAITWVSNHRDHILRLLQWIPKFFG
ncbi:MAG: ATP-binding protein [Cyanobacteria bacterium REEB494]|nr:ATP-binding protein [Cyanobacteria bacterium REEB494]